MKETHIYPGDTLTMDLVKSLSPITFKWDDQEKAWWALTPDLVDCDIVIFHSILPMGIPQSNPIPKRI